MVETTIDQAQLSKYNGISLLAHEVQVLQELEKIVGEPIPAIQTVTARVFGFVHLDNTVTELGLNFKNVTRIPDSIGNFQNLEELWLVGNMLTELPSTIGKLSKLRILFAYENYLEQLPVELFDLTELFRLDLGRNKLEVIPDEIEKLVGLDYLNLMDNRLTQLPSVITKLRKITMILLGGNELEFSDEIRKWFDFIKEQGHVMEENFN